MSRNYDNPFNRNYLFTNADKNRADLTWGDRIRTLLKPMLVQITTGSVYRFKVGNHGEIYLFGWEELPPNFLIQPEIKDER